MATNKEQNYLQAMIDDFNLISNRGLFKDEQENIVASIEKTVRYAYSVENGQAISHKKVAEITGLTEKESIYLLFKVMLGYLSNPSYGFVEMKVKTPKGNVLEDLWLAEKVRDNVGVDDVVEAEGESFRFGDADLLLIRNERV